MIPFVIIRKILLSLVPLVLFYLLKKKGEDKPKKKSSFLDLDKSQIIEGEIVDK